MHPRPTTKERPASAPQAAKRITPERPASERQASGRRAPCECVRAPGASPSPHSRSIGAPLPVAPPVAPPAARPSQVSAGSGVAPRVPARELAIGGRRIGAGAPTFVIAEIGINHNGQRAQAHELIDAAADAGATAVKFQKRSTAALLTRAARLAAYRSPHAYGATYGQHRDALELDAADYLALSAHAERRGLVFLASAWDGPSADFLDALGVLAHKVPSAVLTDAALLARLARTHKPLLVSTGMSTAPEVDAAVAGLLQHTDALVLLQCTSAYPAEPATCDLRVLTTYRERYGTLVGYSGHEPGDHVPCAAVALGACVIEKHLTLDRQAKGSDHRASLEPDRFARLVRAIRQTEAALGAPVKRLHAAELPARRKLAKSLVVTREVPAGATLTREALALKAPGTGLGPAWLPAVLGRRATRTLAADAALALADLEPVQDAS